MTVAEYYQNIARGTSSSTDKKLFRGVNAVAALFSRTFSATERVFVRGRINM